MSDIQIDAKQYLSGSSNKRNQKLLHKLEESSEFDKKVDFAKIIEECECNQTTKKHINTVFKNKEGKFDESNVAVQKLTKDFSGYKFFGAKGLILMAKNFYGLKDSFQATYILESVIENFKEYTDVIEEAQKELDFIKGEEAKRNSSITN